MSDLVLCNKHEQTCQHGWNEKYHGINKPKWKQHNGAKTCRIKHQHQQHLYQTKQWS